MVLPHARHRGTALFLKINQDVYRGGQGTRRGATADLEAPGPVRHEGGGGEAEELEGGERRRPGARALAEARVHHARRELGHAARVVDLILLLSTKNELPVAEDGFEVEVGPVSVGRDSIGT